MRLRKIHKEECDQISVLGVNKQIQTEDINEILGKISYDILHEIADCIINADCENSVKLIDGIYAKGNEPVQIVSNLIQYFRDMMIIKNCTDKELIYSLTQINEANYEQTLVRAEKFSKSEIIQIIDKLSYYTTQIKDTTNKYLWLELCIIDLTNYKNLPSAENLLKRIEELENQIQSGNIQIKQTSERVEIPNRVQNITKPAVQEQKEEISAKNSEEKLLNENKEKQQTETPSQKQNVNTNSDMHNLWVSILQSIDSPPNRAFYSNLAKPVEIRNEKIIIAFS